LDFRRSSRPRAAPNDDHCGLFRRDHTLA